MAAGAYQRIRQSDEAQRKLLEQEESTEEFPWSEAATVPFSTKAHIVWSSVNLILLLVNIVTATFLYLAYSKVAPGSDSIAEYQPLKKLVKYQDQFWDLTLGDRSAFTKRPSAEVDALWDSIAAPPGDVGFVVVQKDELNRMNLTSTPLADGSGYVATIDVFHQLHCLDFLRKAIYNSTYNLTLEKYPAQDLHIAHCIDSLRLSLQCHADVSLVGFRWIRDYPLPWPDFRSTHRCRNFDDILSWAREKMPEVKDQSNLIHPELGRIGTWAKTHKWGNPLARAGGVEFIDEV